MITNFKIYEKVNKEPRLNDFVIVEHNNNIINEIGKITYINNKSSIPYLVEWFDKNFKYYQYGLQEPFLAVEFDEIKYWSDSKEELEQILLNNKFNI